jgi:hypothetical protein
MDGESDTLDKMHMNIRQIIELDNKKGNVDVVMPRSRPYGPRMMPLLISPASI